MSVISEVDISEHFLFPSMIFASKTPHRVQTILGSCVSVCLYDPILCYGGINHFMLPNWNGQGMPSPKYGDIAIHRLIEKMVGFGSFKENLVAKIVGGADQIRNGSYEIGQRNVLVAESILEKENIKIIARNTGGNVGRKIVFLTHSNSVLLKFLSSPET